MAEPRSRREMPPRPRPRTRPDGPDEGIDHPEERPSTLAEQAVLAEEPDTRGAVTASGAQPPLRGNPTTSEERSEGPPAARPDQGPRPRPRQPIDDDEDFQGFDAEINNR